jgi:hypothetical protein
MSVFEIEAKEFLNILADFEVNCFMKKPIGN